MVGFLGTQGSRLVIGFILGPTALGLYDVAARFCLFLEIILIHPLDVLFPTVAKIQNSLPEIQRLTAKVLRTAAIITVPAFVGLACVAPSLIAMLLGEAWVGAVGVIRVLCVATLFNLFVAIYSPVLLAMGKPGSQFVVKTFITITTLLLLTVLAHLGLPFAATAVAIAAGLGWPLQLLVVRYTTNMDVIKQQLVVVPAIIGAVPMAFAVLLYHNALKTVVGDLFLLATEILVGIVVYVCLIVIIQRSFILELASHVKGAARSLVPGSL